MKRIMHSNKEFAWMKWKPAHIKRAAKETLDFKKKAYAAIKRIKPTDRTFENTIYAIEAAGYPLMDFTEKLDFFKSVTPDEPARQQAHQTLIGLGNALVDIEYDEDIYRAVKEYAARKEKLSGPEKKLFDDMMIFYRRMGFELPPAKRERLKANLKKLNKLETVFRKNIDDHHDFIMVTREELEGLSDAYINGLQRDKQGKYRVTLRYPDSVPFMEYAANEAKRKELADKIGRKGGKKNISILQKILAIRKEHAQLLGYKNYAAYTIEVKMAKTEGNVRRFIMNMLGRLHKGLEADLAMLTACKRTTSKDSKARLAYYDVAYCIKRSYYENYDIDSQKIREYFPLQTVKKGMLAIYAKLFGVSFHRLAGFRTWHPDVEAYGVDVKGRRIAYFFLDLYPRRNKYGHAAVWQLHSGRRKSYRDDTYITPYAGMATNFPKPGPGNPSLMSHEDVVTFFHEFGHVMHGILTAAPYGSQSGTAVARDFVEAPSQMLENWVWDKDMLAILSGHYKHPSRKLPADLLKRMIKAKNHAMGYASTRQFVLALYDLLLHTEVPAHRAISLYHELARKYLKVAPGKTNIFPAGFGHLCGYAAGYYGYMWSKVLSSDMFTRFKKEGLLNKKTGAEYRKWILEKGSSMEEMDLVRGFLGRKPNNKAFLKEIGL